MFGMALTRQHHWQCNADDWHGRLRACVRAKGGHFKQLLWQYSATCKRHFSFCQMWHNF